MKKELVNKFVEEMFKLLIIAERDETINGNCFIEFGERSIKVVNPSDVKIKKEVDGCFFGGYTQ